MEQRQAILISMRKKARSHFYSALLHTPWKGRDINIIDTPGSADFIGQVYGALSVVELALITVNAACWYRSGNAQSMGAL